MLLSIKKGGNGCDGGSPLFPHTRVRARDVRVFCIPSRFSLEEIREEFFHMDSL